MKSRPASTSLRASTREIESRFHYLIGKLAVVIQEQHIAGFGGQLLLRRQFPVPHNRLVEKTNDVLAPGTGLRLRFLRTVVMRGL